MRWADFGRLGGPAALLALCLTVGLLGPAQAVINGQPDGNAHPNVGIVVLFDEEGPFVCSGALVAPSTVLTAGHCAVDLPDEPPILEYWVSFEPVNPSSQYVRTHGISGTPDPHPDFDPQLEPKPGSGGAAGYLANERYDVGLIHLSQPASSVYPGITPAPIAPAGVLDTIKRGSKPTVLQVGYGTQRSGPVGQEDSLFVDGTRNRSEFPLRQVRTFLAFGRGNPNDAHGYGAPCFGDSGSPMFLNGSIVVVVAFANGPCTNTIGGPRIDTGPARAFLRSRGLVP